MNGFKRRRVHAGQPELINGSNPAIGTTSAGNKEQLVRLFPEAAAKSQTIFRRR